MAARPGCSRGLSLVEILAILLGVGILVAIGMPLYVGYVRDARLAEARAMAASVLTALQSCVEAKVEPATCGLPDVRERIGVSAGGLSADARWHITRATLTLLSRQPVAFSGLIAVAGRTRDTADTAVTMFQSATGIAMRCNTRASVPPVSPSDGETC